MHLTSLFNQINLAQAENVKPSARKAKIIGEFSQSDVTVTDRPHFLSYKSKYMLSRYGREPYADLRCWIIFDHLSSVIQDISFTNNHALCSTGYPCLTIGEDSGLYSRNLATIMNRDPDITEYYRIAHNASIDYADTAFSTGFTLLLIFKPYSFEQNNSLDQTVYQKMNDTTATGGVSVRYDPYGRLKCFVRSASTNYNSITEQYKLRLRAFNTAVITYDPLASPRIKIRVNGEVMTDDAEETPAWSTDPANRDAYFCIGNNQNAGKAYCGLQEFRQYRTALTDTQCNNLYANKLTIESHRYGETAWLGYTRYPETSATKGFDSTTFDSTCYDTTA